MCVFEYCERVEKSHSTKTKTTQQNKIMAGRFPVLDTSAILKISGDCEKSKNTKFSTNTWLNTYKSWAKVRGKKEQLENYTAKQLNDVLSQFYGEIRKKDGTDYEPDCLRVMQASINRYLLEKNYPISIITGSEFEFSNKVLKGKTRELRQKGMGRRPNKSEQLSTFDENYLWDIGRLGRANPTSLLYTVWFNNVKHFGQRGRHEHSTMTMEKFRLTKDEISGKRYIQFVENSNFEPDPASKQKMFETGGEKCPVDLFEFYISKRPIELARTGRFYLKPKVKYNSEEPWFTVNYLGKNKIGTLMKQIITGTELEESGKKLTNRSGDRTK